MAAHKIRGVTVELGGDTSKLGKALSAVNSKINVTQKQLKDVEKLLKLDPTNTTLLAQQQRLLADAISGTEEKLETLAEAEQLVQQQFERGEVSQKQYDALQREIEATRINLRQMEDKADDAAKAIRDIDEEPIDDVTDAAQKAEDALEDAGKEASSFGDQLKAELVADAANDIVSSLKDVAEESKEYRKIMGSLEVSSEKAGYTAEETAELYKKLYGVLGDDQTAATTVANLQALGLKQKDLLSLVDSSVGAWTQYGDSIPIDGLAEALNETVKTGQVTGNLADVLNWGTAEAETYGLQLKDTAAAEIAVADATSRAEKYSREYSAALKANKGVENAHTLALKESAEEAKSYAEYAQQVLDGMNDWNTSVEEAVSAEDKFNLALGQCGTEAARVRLIMQALAGQDLAATGEAWQENNASLVESNQAHASMQEQLARLSETIEPVFTTITNAVASALEWFNSLDGSTQAFILTTIGLVAVLGPIISVFQTLGSVLSFIAANPIVLLIGAIVALVALIATKGDEIQAILEDVDSFLQDIFVKDWCEIFGPGLGDALNALFAIVKDVWNSIRVIFDGIIDFIRGVFTGDWSRAWEGVKSIFSGIFAGFIAIAKAPINAVIGIVNSAIGGINSLIRGINMIPGVNIGEIGKIPLLASGGEVLQGNAIVGEAGPELLTVAGGRTIVQPLTNSTTNTHNTHLGGVNISVYGAPGQDVEELADVVMDKLQHAYSVKEAALK